MLYLSNSLSLFGNIIFFKICYDYIHSYPKLKLQPVLPLSSFLRNSSNKEYKNMKLRENICYEMINEFCIIVALRIICKRITTKFVFKAYFLKRQNMNIFLKRKLKEKCY